MPVRHICLSLLILVAAVLPAGAVPPAPAVAFETQAVIVTGATPKGKVVLFGVARETGDHSATVVRRDRVLADDDGDADGRTSAALSGMRALGESPDAPDLFNAHDVVAVVDPNRMEYYVEAVSDAP